MEVHLLKVLKGEGFAITGEREPDKGAPKM
jgi:hypothetical protein